jgi:hypothetical protein
MNAKYHCILKEIECEHSATPPPGSENVMSFT